ncbi:MAG: HDOD domain-containing protein [Gammaproteobacteria bacterium]|nr:HDOD domain-containing protein [Gammaproteobacteria bacterium]
MNQTLALLQDSAEIVIAVFAALLLVLFVGLAMNRRVRDADVDLRDHLDPGLRAELEGLNALRDVEPDQDSVSESLDELRGLMSRDFQFDALGDLNLRSVFAMGLSASRQVAAAPKTDLGERLLAELRAELAADRLTLPPFPENASDIRRVITDPNSSNDAVAAVIQRDPALGARVLKIANSAMFAGYEPVADLDSAIGRLGRRALEDLVVSALVGQLFSKSRSALVNDQLKKLWAHSREVAAVAEQLARRVGHLEPQVAMLAGLIHEIGAVPLLLRLDREPELQDDPQALARVVEELAPLVGRSMLQSWRFPESLVQVVAEYDNLDRDSGDLADYADVVLVAKLVCLVGQEQWQQRERPAVIPAFAKLGLSLDQTYAMLGVQAEAIIEVRDGLG